MTTLKRSTPLGHSGGDEAICLYCQILRDTVGKFAEVYRRGGDETLAIGIGLDVTSAKTLAEEFRSTVQKQFVHFGTEKKVLDAYPTVSIGVVIADPLLPGKEIIDILDRTQQQAKDAGKNRVVIADLFSLKATERCSRSFLDTGSQPNEHA